MSNLTDEEKSILPTTTKRESVLEIASAVSSVVPWLGGPISQVLSGMSLGRKMERVREALEGIAEELKDHEAQTSKEYVRTDDFQELSEKTLRSIAEERNEGKRKLLRSFLENEIKFPGKSYDEQMRIFRVLEQLQPDHIRIIGALIQEPRPASGGMGSPINTLSRRLPGMPREHIEDLVLQLNDLRLIKLTSLNTMMTSYGAENLKGSLTSFGREFLKYVKQ